MTVIEAITFLIEERKRDNRIPHCAMINDVRRLCRMDEDDFRCELSRLKKEGKIAFKETVNSWSIFLINDKS